MQLPTITEFSGTQEDKVQPTEFLKMVNRSLMASGGTLPADSDIIRTIGYWLKSDSPAEEWFNEPNTPKAKYSTFKAEFMAKFPNIEKAKKTGPELERELSAMRITTEELGKTELYMGQEAYTHIIFAQKMLDLARQAKIEKTTSSIFSLRDHLPKVLREKVPENQTNWTMLATGIKEIDMGHIDEGIRKYKERKEAEAKIQAKIDQLDHHIHSQTTTPINSPTKAIREQLTCTTVSQPHTTMIPRDPFLSNGGGQGNLFPSQTHNIPFNTAPRTPRLYTPASEDEKNTLLRMIGEYPMQENTANGIALYQDQMRQWKEKNRNQPPNKYTGFPLRPGGAEPGSNECYNCSQTGH